MMKAERDAGMANRQPQSGWAVPPAAKIYEAFTAVADGRVILGENSARVLSSDGKRTYTVTWAGDEYSSNDNASYWQGYTGYPVIAVLMLQGRIRYHATIASLFSKINWKSLNTKHHNDYDAAVSSVLAGLQGAGTDIGPVMQEVNDLLDQIRALPIRRKRP
jgi:hypothetical protein